jgi:hypothetical protein
MAQHADLIQKQDEQPVQHRAQSGADTAWDGQKAAALRRLKRAEPENSAMKDA